MSKLNPRVDFVFKKLFGAEESKDLLIDLINSIVDKKDKVIDIHIKNPYNDRRFPGDKLSILDIKAQDEATGKWFNIEMQVAKQDDYDSRALYYWSRIYVDQVSSGINFDVLTKTISINFLNFNVVPEEDYHNTYKVMNVKTKKAFVDHLEIHFIELEKYSDDNKAKSLLDNWTYFLKEAGELDTVPAELEGIPTIKKAFGILENIKMTAEEREAYEARLRTLRDEESSIRTAKNEGREEGIEIGIEKGAKENALLNARNLLGVIPDELIAEKIGLTLEEVKALK